LEKAVVSAHYAGFDSSDAANVNGWLQAVMMSVSQVEALSLKKLSAAAAKNASRLESRTAARRLADWRAALVRPSPGTMLSDAPPARLAFQWIKGNAGWSKSPLGDPDRNDEAELTQEYEDDVPAHAIDSRDAPRRVWARKVDQTGVPLSDQADVDVEADGWATLWNEGQDYRGGICPHDAPALDPLLPWALRRSAASFPVGTGVGAENIAPRAILRLSDELVKALCAILMATELLGQWPAVISMVLVVLLPKTDGGRRPIGLFPALVRVWARARSMVAKQWEAGHFRCQLFGGSGMGAQKAAWQAAFRAENAALAGGRYAQALLDLVKAFEKVPHDLLIRAASKHGYSPWLLRLSLAAYRLPRTIGVDGTFSRCIQAVCGITAGSVFATTELRLILLDAIDYTCAAWKMVTMSVYVDDATLEAAGPGVLPMAAVAGATDTFTSYVQDTLHLVVSVAKSVANAGTMREAKLTARLCRSRVLTAVRATKLLGTPSAGGRRRTTAPQRIRVRQFTKKALKIKRLRRLGVNTRHIVRAAGTPSITYGWDVMGVADTVLRAARSSIAGALAPEAGGKNPDVVLYMNDVAGATADPAYDAHVLPLKHWALACSQGWQPRKTLEGSLYAAVARLRGATRSVWDVAAGPAAGVAATVWRLGWAIRDAFTYVDDLGDVVDFVRDSPAAITARVKASVRRWQFMRATDTIAGCIPHFADLHVAGNRLLPFVLPEHLQPPSFIHAWSPQSVIGVTDPVRRLLHSRTGKCKVVPTYGVQHRPWLRSAMCGGQWPQTRIVKLYPDEVDNECQLCRAAPGTLAHRHHCEATRPPQGWPLAPRVAREFVEHLDGPRQLALQTRGFLALRLDRPLPWYEGWTRWVLGDPVDFHDEATWYIDGSFFDAGHSWTGATGFGVVVISPDGDVCGMCHGAPPSWVTNAAGAEGWAMYTALRSCHQPPRIVTDCLGLVTQLERGLADGMAPHRPLARLWCLIAATLDNAVPQEWLRDKLAWMPAHTSRAAVGRWLKSNGRPVSLRDWRANRLVDKLAKLAAGCRAPPKDLLKLLQTASTAAEHAGACLGLATHAANSYKVTTWREDGTAVQALRRDAWLPPYLDRGAGHRPRALGKRPPPRPTTTRAEENAHADQNAALENSARQQLLHAKGAQGRARAAASLREAETEARGLQAWLADKAADTRPQGPPAGPTAAERLEALRQRVVSRAASSRAA